jgi:hypothetical protein
MRKRDRPPTPGARAELYAALDAYLAALRAGDPRRVRWLRGARCSENNVLLAPGDGLWATLTGLGSYDLRCADVSRGQVVFFGSVIETHDESPFTLRLQLRGGAIAQAECLVVRAADSGIPFPKPAFVHKAVLNATLAPAQRMSRAAMIALADGYFSTLERNDGTLHTRFHPGCNRVENGVQTTNNPDVSFLPSARLGCEAQFRLGIYRYDDRLRARRYPLVDVERGLVLAGGFIDHCGRLGRYRLSDGTEVESPVRRPHSFALLELFKLRDGAIEQIEANFITVPYHMPCAWSAATSRRPARPRA